MKAARLLAAVAVAAVTAAVVFLAAGAATAATTHPVVIENFQFSNGATCGAGTGGSTTTVTAGDTVMWHNCEDGVSHTVTSDDGRFPSSGPLAPGTGYSVTFPDPGRYGYHCSIHPSMTGIVVVEDARPSTTTSLPVVVPTTAKPKPPKATTTTQAPTTTTVAPKPTTTTGPNTTTTSSTTSTTSTTEPLSPTASSLAPAATRSRHGGSGGTKVALGAGAVVAAVAAAAVGRALLRARG